MAEKQFNPLKKLEEQLTCSVCLDHLTNPKTLSCLHTFCHRCLEHLTDYNTNEVRCPTCRSEFELGEEGIDSLPTAFLVNNLMDVHGMLKKVSNDKMVVCDVCEESFASGYCQQCESFSCDTCLGFHNKWKKNRSHRVLTLEELADSAYDIPRVKSEAVMKCTGHNKPLDIYCDTCDELICQHCTVRIHKDHDYDVVSDVYDAQRKAIEDTVTPIDTLMNEGNEHMESLMTEKEVLAIKRGVFKEDIQHRVSQIMDQLFTAAGKLSKKVDTAFDYRERVIDESVEEIKLSLQQLASTKDYIQQSLKVGSPLQVLSSKAKLIEHAKGATKTCDFSKYQVREPFSVRLDKGAIMKLSTIDNSIGRVRVCEGSTGPRVDYANDDLVAYGDDEGLTVAESFSEPNSEPVGVPISSTGIDSDRKNSCSVELYSDVSLPLSACAFPKSLSPEVEPFYERMPFSDDSDDCLEPACN